MSNNMIRYGKLGDIEKLATEFSKHEILLYPPAKKLTQEEQIILDKAYKDIGKALGLPNREAVKLEIQGLKRFCYSKMRRCVRISMIRGRSSSEALTYAPEWLKNLDKPLKLLEKALKMESVSNARYYSSSRRMNLFMWELLQGAARAAASWPLSSARALTSRRAVRALAAAARVDEELLRGLWSRYYQQVMLKLKALIAVGDCPERLLSYKRFTLQDWRVVDIALMYDIHMRVVHDHSFKNAITLYPMILLFKLIVAAKEKIDKANAEKLKSNESHTGRQNEVTGVRIERSSEPHTKDDTASSTKVAEDIVSPEHGDARNEPGDDGLNSKENMNSKNELETPELWALVHLKYTICGRSASVVLLQKRWYELKQQARWLLCGTAPVPLLLAIAKRFPFILTNKLPSWAELVRNNQVYLDSDLESCKSESFHADLDIPEINENILLDELYDWSDDEIEIINENREVITVADSDDEQTNVDTNSDKTIVADTIKCNTDSKSNEDMSIIDEDDSSIIKLESLDPASSKVKIVFEDDSDSDVNDYLNSTDSKSFNPSRYNDLMPIDNDTNESITQTIQVEPNDNFAGIIKEEPGVENNDTNKQTDDINIINSPRSQLSILSNSFNDETESKAKITNVDVNEVSRDYRYLKFENNDSDDDNDVDEQHAAVDKKLIKISHVVLTPLEDIDDWTKHSKDESIDCRSINLGNLTKPVSISTKELAKCRPYVPDRASTPHLRPTNGISIQKKLEIYKIPKSLKQKRRFLTKHLKLSRTYFSLEFWNERNVQLLELCKPVSVKLGRTARAVKKVELADIDEVRRINKNILTAQVAPITVGENNKFVNDSSAIPQPIVQESPEKSRKNSSDDQDDSENLAATDPTNFIHLPSENEVKEMIKSIVRKGKLAKIPDPVVVLPAKNDTDFGYMQKALDRDIREISAALFKTDEMMERKRVELEKEKEDNENKKLKLDSNINCSKEWKRQKSQNLKYFNFTPAADESDSDNNVEKEVKRKRRKRSRKTKSNKEIAQPYTVNENIFIYSDNDGNDVNLTKRDTVINFRYSANENSRNTSDSDNEDARLIINLDTEPDKELKRKSVDAQTDMSTIPKRANIEVTNTKDITNIAPDSVIDLCDDSDDADTSQPLHTSTNIVDSETTLHDDKEKPNNVDVPQIKIKIVKNSIEINGDCESDIPVSRSGEVITFLSKVAAKIQEQNMLAPPPDPTSAINNSTVYYVVQSMDKKHSKKVTNAITSDASTCATKSTASTSVDIKSTGNTSTGTTNTGKTTRGNTNTVKTSTGKTCTGNTSIGKRSSAKTSTGKTSTSNTCIGKTSTGITSTGKSSTDNTSTGKTSTGNASTDKTTTGKRSTGKSSTGKTSTAITSIGKTRIGKTSTGKTSTDNTSTDNTSTDNTSTGKTSAGDTSIDKTNISNNGTDKTNTGYAGTGNTITGDTSTGTGNIITGNINTGNISTGNIAIGNTCTRPLITNTDTTNVNVATSNTFPYYYVVKIPDLLSGSTTAVPQMSSPTMPVIQNVSSLSQIPQQNLPQVLAQPKLLVYPQNMGYAQLSLASMPMQRNNSVPLPITSVTAWPMQNDGKVDGPPWASVNASQLYPVVVTSGTSTSHLKESGESKPMLNLLKTNNLNELTVTKVTSQPSEDARRTAPWKHSNRRKYKKKFVNDSFS